MAVRGSLGGIAVDKTAPRVSVSPLKLPLRLPLLQYADWQKGVVPWLTMRQEGDRAMVAVEPGGEQLLQGVAIVRHPPGELW